MDELIERLRRLAEWPDEADPVTIGDIAGEAAAALEASREDGVMQRFADTLLGVLLGVLNDTQDALGFTDEDKLCPNGSIEIVAAINELREDAERWRHARRILTVEDIESSQDMFDAFGVEGDEHENRKADAAIDQARGKGGA